MDFCWFTIKDEEYTNTSYYSIEYIKDSLLNIHFYHMMKKLNHLWILYNFFQIIYAIWFKYFVCIKNDILKQLYDNQTGEMRLYF